MVRIMLQRLHCNVFMLSYRGWVLLYHMQMLLSYKFLYLKYLEYLSSSKWMDANGSFILAVMEKVMAILLSMELQGMLRCAHLLIHMF